LFLVGQLLRFDGTACCHDDVRHPPEKQAGLSWLCSRVRSVNSARRSCLRARSRPRSRATDQVSNIPACCMITFTFRRSTLTALKETSSSTFDPPYAGITLG
jgi:hypothetical protein